MYFRGKRWPGRSSEGQQHPQSWETAHWFWVVQMSYLSDLGVVEARDITWEQSVSSRSSLRNITFLKKLCGRRSKKAWGGTVRCSRGLKWQEMLCSCGRTRGVGSIWRGKRAFNCVCEFNLREWNVFIWHGYLLILLFFIMYMSPASPCENVRNTVAKCTGAVWIMPE